MRSQEDTRFLHRIRDFSAGSPEDKGFLTGSPDRAGIRPFLQPKGPSLMKLIEETTKQT